MENSMWMIEKMKIKKKKIVNNFHLLTENQRLPNMLGQHLPNMLGQRLCTTCWANVFWMSKVLMVLHRQPTLAQRKLQLKAQRWSNFNLLSGETRVREGEVRGGRGRCLPSIPSYSVKRVRIMNSLSKQWKLAFIYLESFLGSRTQYTEEEGEEGIVHAIYVYDYIFYGKPVRNGNCFLLITVC